MQPDEQPSGNESLKQRLIDEMHEPLLVAIEQVYSELVRRENIVMSRAMYMYRRSKWDVVRGIIEVDHKIKHAEG